MAEGCRSTGPSAVNHRIIVDWCWVAAVFIFVLRSSGFSLRVDLKGAISGIIIVLFLILLCSASRVA